MPKLKIKYFFSRRKGTLDYFGLPIILSHLLQFLPDGFSRFSLEEKDNSIIYSIIIFIIELSRVLCPKKICSWLEQMRKVSLIFKEEKREGRRHKTDYYLFF